MLENPVSLLHGSGLLWAIHAADERIQQENRQPLRGGCARIFRSQLHQDQSHAAHYARNGRTCDHAAVGRARSGCSVGAVGTTGKSRIGGGAIITERFVLEGGRISPRFMPKDPMEKPDRKGEKGGPCPGVRWPNRCAAKENNGKTLLRVRELYGRVSIQRMSRSA